MEPVTSTTPLDSYCTRVAASSTLHAERTANLCEANPSHVALLLSVKMEDEVNEESKVGHDFDSESLYLAFIEHYSTIKDLLLTTGSTNCCKILSSDRKLEAVADTIK